MVQLQQSQKLAIVIPAYKSNFLRETLVSLEKQTNKAFVLYIGDDNSPENLWEIVKDFTDTLCIKYRKFETNLGGKDLVAHWSRCIDMVEEEEWIWLFSDDDLLEHNCVSVFFDFIEKNKQAALVHFPIKVIDNQGNIIPNFGGINPFPPVLSSAGFYEEKLRGRIQSFVVEYVFKKSLYEQEGGLANFDLAWCADDATWIKFASRTGIYTLTGAAVKWRYSGVNISSQTTNQSIFYRKIEAKIAYLHWVTTFFKERGLTHTLDNFSLIKWFILELKENNKLDILTRVRLTYQYLSRIVGFSQALLGSLYIFAYSLKKGLILGQSS